MPLWTETTAPTYKPDAVLGDKGWEDKDTKELLVAMNVTTEEKAEYDTIQNPPAPAPEPTVINATEMVAGTEYTIVTAGDTDFTLVGAVDNNIGTVFTSTGAGTGTGTVSYIA